MSRIGGKRAHRNGATFESLIERACLRYQREGVAYIEKSPEPMRPIKAMGLGRFLACFTKAAQPDYKGTLRGGRAVCFEAKHTEGERIEQSRVTDEQAEALDKHDDLRAVCFVLVSFRFERFYRVPWHLWASMPERFGKVSVNEKDLAPYRVEILRFLDGIAEVQGL